MACKSDHKLCYLSQNEMLRCRFLDIYAKTAKMLVYLDHPWQHCSCFGMFFSHWVTFQLAFLPGSTPRGDTPFMTNVTTGSGSKRWRQRSILPAQERPHKCSENIIFIIYIDRYVHILWKIQKQKELWKCLVSV